MDYGWVVVAALCVTETVSWGILYDGFPVFLPPMEAELGWSRVQANGARALAPVGAALLQVAVGGYERVFWMLTVSLVLAGTGVLLLTRRTSR